MHIYNINPFYSGNGKQNLWQTMKTLMKHRIRWYFLRVCRDKKQSSGGGGGGVNSQSDYEDYPSFLAYVTKVSLVTCIGPD